MKQSAMILLAVAAVCVISASAPACDGIYGNSYGYGYLYRNLDQKIPYFAAYPPVYYSQPVARSYGYSPFAYPPGTRTPEIVSEPIEPETIINPYVEQPAKDAGTQKNSTKDKDKVTSTPQPTPLVIMNPFVESSAPLVQVSN